MKYPITLVSIALIASTQLTTHAFARNNILTGGVTLSYDFQDRSRDSDAISLTGDDDEDYSRLVFSPFLQLVSSSQRDRYEIIAAPGIRYDLDDSDTDIDGDITLAAERSLTRAWSINGSNSFFLGDEDLSDDDFDAIEPDLSDDLGRRRYWRNSFNIGVDNIYKEDSLLRFGGGWIILRNEDNNLDADFEEYDRYTFSLSNEHRFTARWRSLSDFSVVRGNFNETDDTDLSDDLYEYFASLGIENNSFDRNPLTLTYSFAGVRYDESLQNDSDIHEVTFTWRRDYSSRLFTVLGIGPSYEKTESFDENWGVNGIAEINYIVQHGSYNFILDKGFETDNFSGTDEQGVIDTWNARFTMVRQLSRSLEFDGRLGYTREERDNATLADEEEEDRYLAGVGFGYTFWRYYTAGLDYTFIHQESNIDEDDFDDHRVLVSLTWERDLLQW